MGATLTITRIGKKEIRFVYHEAGHAVVNECRVQVSPELRANIEKSYEEYAECLKGVEGHEIQFTELGMAICNVVLPAPVKNKVRDHSQSLTIMTDDPTLPWEIMHDGTDFLALKMPLARVLIIPAQLGSYLRMGVPAASARHEFSSLIIADPTEDLPGAAQEARALRDLLATKGECRLLLGTEANFQSIVTHLVARPYSVIHLCGHVDYEPRKHESFIRLREGSISAQNVGANFRGSPIVFLNACHSDKARLSNPAAASSQIESFAQAFMVGNEKGIASAVVGTMWKVPDEPEDAIKEFVLTFYGRLLYGICLGEAMRASRLASRQASRGPVVWGPYVLYGDPDLVPFRAAPATPAKTANSEEEVAAEAPDPGAESTANIRNPSLSSQYPAAAHSRAAEPEEEEAELQLDSNARQVLVAALREMTQMEQSGLSSLHLLMGICETSLEPFNSFLAERKIDKESLCESARRRSRELIPTNEEGFGVSEGFTRIFKACVERAKNEKRDKIRALDLLVALLKCQGSQALEILALAGVRPEEILERIIRPPVLPDWFDAPTLEAMQHAARLARESHLDLILTPHILVGLLRVGSVLSVKLLRGRNVNIEQLCLALLALIPQAPAVKIWNGNGNGHGNGHAKARATLGLHDGAAQVLQRARELALRTPKGRIGEVHLLEAIMERKQSNTNQLLAQIGADPAQLMADLRQMRGEEF